MDVTAMLPKEAGLESLITEKKTCWERLQEEKRPIFIYGMGDGAIKIMNAFQKYGITVSGIFASDEFVRGHSFAGYHVHKLSEVEEMVDDFVIVLAFAAGYPELFQYILQLAKKHTLYAPDVPVIGGGLFTYQYCMDHLHEFNQVYRMLADNESRQVYLNVIQFKISGNIHYLEKICSPPGKILRMVLRLSRNESFMDVGAYNGDTLQEFLRYTDKKYYLIHAIEPDQKSFRKLENYIQEHKLKSIKTHHCVAWCNDTELKFNSRFGRQSALYTEGTPVPARRIDTLLENDSISVIKMDVEGFEREVLWGAREIISKRAPKLCVSIYHRNQDLFELPLLVKRLNPRYQIYIRHRLYIPAWDTNLYAVAK